TDLGRERAGEYLRTCQYVGPAPVSLEAYGAQVRGQTIVDLTVTREAMRDAFSGIVIREAILDQFGAAMNSGRAIFVYGPAGSGKTFLAGKLARLLQGNVHVPYAILVENQVIQVFDPLSHVRVETLSAEVELLAQGKSSDPRWVLCRRPVVVAGGELTLGMLDLRFDEGTRFYAAPPQLKANNGLFIIDDLGRQLVQAKDLMNRWIVPLDRRVDFLALHTGEKFIVPFDVTVVFCTNLSPADLADEAFLRRLGYKIPMGALDETQYRAVCKQVCQSFELPYVDQAVDYLLARFKREGRPLLACTPRDLLGQVRDQARYRGLPPKLSRDLVDWAWDNYFVSENGNAINSAVKGAQP
ncbi:MAG: ATP-binding protein, partial [Betaproteobacteria bacterium]|nr:ATP-binding protein [Betaproteobacteria bacterium]